MHRFAFRVALGAVLSAAACAALGGEITVYTNLESDEVAEYVKVAQKDLPDIKVNVLRLSTGDLAARLAAESANPRNDVIWALSLTNMLDPRILALTEAYVPKALALTEIDPGSLTKIDPVV